MQRTDAKSSVLWALWRWGRLGATFQKPRSSTDPGSPGKVRYGGHWIFEVLWILCHIVALVLEGAGERTSKRTYHICI